MQLTAAASPLMDPELSHQSLDTLLPHSFTFNPAASRLAGCFYLHWLWNRQEETEVRRNLFAASRLSCEGRAAHLHLCLAVRPQLEVEPAEAGRAGRGSALGSGSPPQTPGRAGPVRFRPCN